MAHDEQAQILSEAQKVEVRPMQLREVAQMANWGLHQDLRYDAYNFPYRTQQEYFQWYRSKRQAFRKYLFGAYLGDELIGYITLKQIKWIRREAFMGIVFNPDRMNAGLGTSALKAYLAMVIKAYGMKKIHLKTACFNLRGQRCYEKAGFHAVETKFEPYEDQSQNFELMLKYGDFQMVGMELWTEYIYMDYIADNK